jgi:two-component system nitrogen regulation response regulator NtrX
MDYAAEQPGSDAEVVIIDDDAETCQLLAEVLAERGYHVRTAANGRDGLSLIAERPPALILLDLDMPVLNGAETAATLMRIDRGMERIPLVIVSGNVRLSAAAASIGTPYLVGKPYTVELILRVVGRALEERSPPMPSSVMP